MVYSFVFLLVLFVGLCMSMCFLCLFILFSNLFVLFAYLFYKERKKEGVYLDGWRNQENLGGDEGGKTGII